MTYAPIVVFGFNRPDALKNTIASLLRNEEAKDSDLFVFVDGPRDGKVGEKEKVKKVREYVKSIKGFKSLHYTFSEKNKGLADSIIGGVSQVINQHGKIIVLEDDLVLMPNFLNFMNQGLERYQNEEKVFSVCGDAYKVDFPDDYDYDAYLYTRTDSWGWATWKDRWNTVDWELNDWDSVEKNRIAFKQFQGSDVFRMLKGWKTGENHSWAIRFCYAQFVQRRYTVLPNRSLVKNAGYGGTGTHCPEYCRYKFVYDKTAGHGFKFPPVGDLDSRITSQVMHYDSLPIRIKSRLINMYLKYRHQLLCK